MYIDDSNYLTFYLSHYRLPMPKTLLMHKIVLLLSGLFLYLSSFSQSVSVSGEVQSKDEVKAVPNAVISLFTPVDSVLFKFARTDAQGHFKIGNLPAGDYIMMASHPFYADMYFDLELNENKTVPVIELLSKAKLLQEVIIKTGAPIRVKGDTTVYTADSFAVGPNANVEELLKKLPGMQVDKDGNITAMGESVKKVLVDGEEFFGDDPGMAIKNLRADAVKEVQVFDKKSDQAEFTGIDDGNSQKTINLKLKEDKKNGYFGKIDLAGGPASASSTDARYNTNLMFSSFKGKRKLSAFLLNGNTGQDGMSWEDQQKYSSLDMQMEMGDDGSIMITSFGDANESYVNTDNGFTTNLNGGVNYFNKWSDKYSLNFSPKYNEQHYSNRVNGFTQTTIGDSILNQNSDNISRVNRNNKKMFATSDLQIDSSNSIKITNNANFYESGSNQFSTSQTTGASGVLKNSSERDLRADSKKSVVSGSILYRHKFKKERRTLAVTTSWNFNHNDGTTFLKSNNTTYKDGLPAEVQDLNQMKINTSSTQSLSAKIQYTEPLSEKWSLQLGYILSSNRGSNNQNTFNYEDGSGKYEEKVDSLSNDFKQNIIQNQPSFTLNFKSKKVTINAGSGFGFTHFDLQDITMDKDYLRNYTNFYPQANLSYTYKPNHTIRVNYSGYTRQPSVDQLQPLRNNNDFFYQRIGNPDLRPSFSQTISLFHQNYNFISDFWTYQSVYFNTTQNAFTTNNTVDLATGKTTSQTVNVSGNYSASFNTGISFKIKKIDTRFNLGPRLYYGRYANIINGVHSFSNSFSPTMSAGLNKSKERKYDISVSDDFGYNINNNPGSDNKIKYYTNSFYVNGVVYHKKVWSLAADYTYLLQQKTMEGNENLSRHLLNIRLQRVFSHDAFTAYIAVRDLLNQNFGIDRNFSNNTYSEQINDRLKRYFLIGFTWNFKNN